jgi:CHAT domain-containing protein
VDSAIRLAYEVLSEARQFGLARPEIMAHGTLGSMAASGADISDHLGVLGPQSRAAALQEMHTRVVAEFHLDPIEARFETSDTGATANELAALAQNHCAYKLAAEYFRTAVAITRQWEMPFERINRLAGLRAVLTHLDDEREVNTVANEISAVVESGKAPIRGQVVGRRALAAHLAKSDRPAAIRHLRTALDLTEQQRLELPPGPNRADFDRQFRDVPYMLADLLRQEKQNEGSFDALQLVQGRRMIDALAAKTTAPTADAPLTAGEVRRLLARVGDDAVLVDFAVNRDGLTGYIFAGPELHVVYVAGNPSALGEADQGDVREREARLVSLCLNNSMLQELATAVAAVVPPDSRLMIVTDQLLNNLPLHAVPVNGRSWSDQMPIGYLPTAAVLRFPSSANHHNSVLVAGDSRGDLPGAAEECRTVSAALNASALLGQACTQAAIEDALRKAQPSIVHLAVHGRGDPRFGGRSSLLLADGKGGVEWVDFQTLTAFPWTAKLVVFSGCSTGVIGRRHGSQLLSVANAALEAGATSVVASLWPVDDEYAKSFMTAFYQDLTSIRPNESADLRLLLRQARESASQQSRQSSGNVRRDGRHFGYPIADQPPATTDPLVADALMWAPFCLFGHPVLRL